MFRWKNKKLDTREKTKVLKHWASYSLLLVTLLAMTFFGVCTPMGQQMGPRGSAGRVAGEVISDLEFRRTYQNLYQTYSQQLRENFDPVRFKLSSQALNQLVDQRVTLLNAKDLGLIATEDEVVEMLKTQSAFHDENGAFNPEYFKNFLRRNVYTEKTFVDSIQRSLTVQKYQELGAAASFVSDKTSELDYKLSNTKLNFEYLKFTPKLVSASLTDQQVADFIKSNGKDIEEYYNANISEFSQPEQVKARHILVAFKDARNASAEASKRSKEDARKRAESILKEVKASSAKFGDIAKAKTDEPSGKTTGGDLGWFSRERMVEEFSDAAFKMEKDQISEIVETPFGFHIIKLEDKKVAKKTTLDEARTEIAKNLLKEKNSTEILEARAAEYLKKLQAGESVNAMLSKDNLKWEKTGDVGLTASYVTGLGSDNDVLSKIYTIEKVGAFYPEVIGKEDKFIVRLQARKPADVSKMDSDALENQAKTAEYRQANRVLKMLEQQKKQDLKNSGRIWLSESHQDYDQQNQSGG